MKSILFVDDEPNVLEGLQRMLYPMRKEWRMVFAQSGEEALKRMEEEPFDVIVSDMRMPGMDGATLLAEVMKRFPQTVRIVLTGQTGNESVFRSVGAAHQFLMKPCNPTALKACVDRAFTLRDLLNNDALKRVVARVESLPALPATYTRLIKELQSPETSLAAIGKIIETDVAMTAKVLQLVNSAFFGLRQHVASATQAVTYLGLDTIKALVLMAGVFAQAHVTKLTAAFSLESLWRHSMLVGVYAQAISRSAGADDETIRNAFTAGVLHDAGILILVENFAEDYRKILEICETRQLPLAQVEEAGLGCTHAGIGAYLLGIWGLPDPIVEAVAFHHSPGQCAARIFTPLSAVHIADVFAHEMTEAEHYEPGRKLCHEYLEALGLQEKLGQWREICSKDISK